MKSLDKITDNDLSELSSLTYQIGSLMQKYYHVYDLVPQSIKRELNQFVKNIDNEISKRQED